MSMLLAAMLWTSITARGIINPIVVAAPEGGDSALYFTIRNSNQREDRLLRVTCDCAERIEVRIVRDAGGPSVHMPPRRLVELRPGADRFMRLVRLRRPLVAGQTVAMTFHYSDGSEVRDVHIVADAQAGWTAGLSGEGPRRLAAMADLAGWCWRATLDAERTDTRCFSPAYGNFLQERVVFDGGPPPYTGYTLYSHDVMARSTSYEYRGQDGRQRFGRVVPNETGITFADYPQQDATGQRSEMLTRIHWRRDGPDAWLVVGEGQRSGEWREVWRMRMVRAGPSPAL